VAFRGFRNYVRVGTLNDFPDSLKPIADAITARVANPAIPNVANIPSDSGPLQVPVQMFSGGTTPGIEHDGKRYVAQNQTTSSRYARLAADGHQVIWVFAIRGGYIGLILDAEVWIDPDHRAAKETGATA
jgi:hypothetical protein